MSSPSLDPADNDRTRTVPLRPPRPLFLAEDITDSDFHSAYFIEEVPNTATDVFRSPSSPILRQTRVQPSLLSSHSSGNSSPKGGSMRDQQTGDGATNPFSPPGSVVSFSLPPDVSTLSSVTHTSGNITMPSTVPQGIVVGHYPFPTPTAPSRSRPTTGTIPGASRPGTGTTRESFAPPPTRPMTVHNAASSPTTSATAFKVTDAKRAKSTMLTSEIEKPWIKTKDTRARLSYVLTYLVACFGLIASFLRIYFGYRGVPLLSGNLCLILDDEFDQPDGLDLSVWEFENSMGGFGNGEFEMTTTSPNNTFLRDGYLYILPTLTSDIIGKDSVLNGYTYNVTDCTTGGTNDTQWTCGAVSNSTADTVINPVMASRLSTKSSRNIQFGRVEIRAKIPTGDWLWPALWMLPVNDSYGPWPMSGEIDIMESRGNGPSYPDQGTNYVRASLNWGPETWINEVWRTYGWWTKRRGSYADEFHTYVLEWDEQFIRLYVDSRLHHMLELQFKEPFFQMGDFPPVIANGSDEIILQNPWVYGSVAAPFDKPFYLIMNVAVGGTNGWFPDNAGNKPWINGAENVMQQFAQAQDQWYSTWPQDDYSRAMVIDYVKMWQKC